MQNGNITNFTFLEGLRGMVDALRRVSRTERRGAGFLTRYQAEVEGLLIKERAGTLTSDDKVRAKRMLATCATALATISSQVMRLSTTTTSATRAHVHSHAAGDACNASALHIARHVWVTCARLMWLRVATGEVQHTTCEEANAAEAEQLADRARGAEWAAAAQQAAPEVHHAQVLAPPSPADTVLEEGVMPPYPASAVAGAYI
jgi:hypothetical protein